MERSCQPSGYTFVVLDALRGLAAGVVVLSHASLVLFGFGGIQNAGLAVDFFFMLSGFVLTHAYRAKLNGGDYVRTFLFRRVVRLFPLIVIATIISVIPFIFRFSDYIYLLRLSIQGFFLIPEYLPRYTFVGMFPMNPPAWSLFYEMLASLFLLLVFGEKAVGRSSS